jgi:PAS domain S-box-containing protein
MTVSNSDYYFLQGGGEMGEMIRAKDWSKTSLGDPSDWPQSLRTMVGVMLDNPFGMYIAWGSDYIQLYNDGYRPILGATKHPQALGISTRETFCEIWHIIESMFDGVMKGKAIGFPDFMLPLNRYGYTEECYFDFSYSPIRKDNGEVGGVLVTVIETTEKKRATDALKESNARYLNNIMQAPVAMCIFRGENYVVEIANEQMLSIWGKQADEVINKPIFEGLPEAKHQGLEVLLENVYSSGEKFVANERPVKLPRNGKIETTYVSFVYDALKEADGTISGIVVIAVEVTPQVVSRSKVEESEQKVRALVENAPFPIAVYVGNEMTIELANQSIIDIWGRGNDVIGKSYKELMPELKNQSVFEQIEKVLATGVSFHTKNTPLDLMVGGKLQTFYFNYSFTPLYDVAGNIYGVMNTGVDLTDLNMVKKQIEESAQTIRSMVLESPIGICVIDADTMVSEIVNDSFIEIAGKPMMKLLANTTGKHLRK